MTVNLSPVGGAAGQFFDANGDPLSGGKLYTYVAGTTTPLTAYTSYAGTTAHTNPIILDAAGRPPNEIWLSTGQSYKFVLLTSTNTQIGVWDNISGINGTGLTTNAASVVYNPAGATAVASTVQAKLREFVSVKDFGAVGDGVTVDTAAIQSALDTLGLAGGGSLYIPEGTYITRELNVSYSNIYVFGDGPATLLKRDGSWTGTNRGIFILNNLSQDLENISFSNFAIDFNGTDSFGFGFKLGAAPSLPAWNTNRNIRITDIRIYDSNPQVTTGDKWAIAFRGNLENVWIERCHSSGDMQLTAGGVVSHKNINILNNCCYIGRANGIAMSTPGTVDGLSIIGNYIEAQSLSIFLGPDQIYSAVPVGTWRNIVIANNRLVTKSTGSSSDWAGIYLNAAPSSYRDVTITGNVIDNKDVQNNQNGIWLTNQTGYAGQVIDRVTITGNVIRNLRRGIFLQAAGGVQITGNYTTDCGEHIYAEQVTKKCSISGNTLIGGQNGIQMLSGEFLISGNNSIGGASQTGSFVGRVMVNPPLGATVKAMIVDNKLIDGAAGSATNCSGVYFPSFAGTANIEIINNDLRGNTEAIRNPPANARIQNNLGFVTNNGGKTAAIATGTTVNHGCVGTPDIVLVTPLATGPTNVTVSSITATTFTINFGGGGSHAFAWEAKTSNFYQ